MRILGAVVFSVMLLASALVHAHGRDPEVERLRRLLAPDSVQAECLDPQIATLQRALNLLSVESGDDPISVDGCAGPQTTKLLDSVSRRIGRTIRENPNVLSARIEDCAFDAGEAEVVSYARVISYMFVCLLERRAPKTRKTLIQIVDDERSEPLKGRTVQMRVDRGLHSVSIDKDGNGMFPGRLRAGQSILLAVDPVDGGEELLRFFSVSFSDSIRIGPRWMGSHGTAITTADLAERLGRRVNVCGARCRDGDGAPATLGAVARSGHQIRLDDPERPFAWSPVGKDIDFVEIASLYCHPETLKVDGATPQGGAKLPVRGVYCANFPASSSLTFTRRQGIALVLSLGSGWFDAADPKAWSIHLVNAGLDLVRGLESRLAAGLALRYYLSSEANGSALELLGSAPLAASNADQAKVLKRVYRHLERLPRSVFDWRELTRANALLGQLAQRDPGLVGAIVITRRPQDGRDCPLDSIALPVVVASTVRGAHRECRSTVVLQREANARTWMTAVAETLAQEMRSAR